MKKTLTLMLLASAFAFNASAQISDGYYRVQNTYTDRYISIEDNNPANYSISTITQTVSMNGIRTHKPGAKVNTSPSTIMYIKNASGNKYDIQAQGTGIYAISREKLHVTLEKQSDGSYLAYGSYGAYSLTLADDEDDEKSESYVKNASTKAQYWWAKKVDTGDNYLGIAPDVQVGNKYYGTFYASFPIQLASDGMKAYIVTEAAGSGFEMEEITGDIPANTPVIIECSSNDPARNKVLPVSSSAKLSSTNWLYGVLCDRVTQKTANAETYNSQRQRALGTSDGKLAFVKASGSQLTSDTYLRANKAYLLVPADAADVLTVGGSTAINSIQADAAKDKGTYTLTGVRIPDGVTPRPGIYIKNGKKIVIR